MAMLDEAELGKRFDRHRQTEATAPAFELVHATAKLAATVLNEVLPPGRKAALALTALEEALMHANGSIACEAGDDYVLPEVDVTEQLDDIAERTAGPLHIRSQLIGGGGAVAGASGGDIGPGEPSSGADLTASDDEVPVLVEIDPAVGASGAELDDDAVHELVERQGSLGPADELHRRAR